MPKGSIEFEQVEPTHPDAVALARAATEEGERVYADLGLGPAPSLAELVDARGRILLARLGGRPIGCGALRTLGPRTAEIKRMFVVADLRGRGIGRELLVALEGAARELDYERVRLDTGSRQQAAIGLYRSSGYQEIRDYNAKPGADLWFEKRL